jgi:cation transport ATPase
MNRREKRAERRSRKQREAAVREVEDRQFTLRRFVDRALFIWMPVVISIVAVVIVIIWQMQ